MAKSKALTGSAEKGLTRPHLSLAHNAFIRMNRHAIAMMFVCLGCVCIVIIRCTFNADFNLWLDSPMLWAPWHQSMSTYSQPSFSSSTWKRGGVRMCKLNVISQEWLKIQVKLLLSGNRKSHMSSWLAQQWMTLSDLQWPFHALHAISVVAGLLVCTWYCATISVCYTSSLHTITYQWSATMKQNWMC